MENEIIMNSIKLKSVKDFKNIIDVSVIEAKDIVREKGHVLRIVNKNGKDSIITNDFNPHRINVKVDDGIITKVINFG